MENNKNERKEALSWWRNTFSEEDRKNLCSKFKPNWFFEMVCASSSAIEDIYKKHHELVNKETNILFNTK